MFVFISIKCISLPNEFPAFQGGWGKRAWSNLASTWGKRDWGQFRGAWGKRAWDELRPAWGKRSWDKFNGAWGKRAPEQEEQQWEVAGGDNEPEDLGLLDNLDSLSDQQLARLANLLFTSGNAAADVQNSLNDEEQKRNWSNLRGAWGKRAWNQYKGNLGFNVFPLFL